VDHVHAGRCGFASVAVGVAVATAPGIEKSRAGIGSHDADTHAAAVIDVFLAVAVEGATVVRRAGRYRYFFDGAAGQVLDASQRVRSGIGAAGRDGRWDRSLAEKQIADRKYSVAQVDLAAIVRVGSFEAARFSRTKEKVPERGNGVAQIQAVILVRVAALERGRTLRCERHKRYQRNNGDDGSRRAERCAIHFCWCSPWKARALMISQLSRKSSGRHEIARPAHPDRDSTAQIGPPGLGLLRHGTAMAGE